MISSCMNQEPLIPLGKLEAAYRKGFAAPLVFSMKMEVDPWLVAKQVLDHPNVFFLDGSPTRRAVVADGGEAGPNARYSYLGWDPFMIYEARHPKSLISDLRNLFRKYRGLRWEELPFFSGGAVGYFSYELARVFERLPDLAKDDFPLTPAKLLFVRDLLVFDRGGNNCFLIANLIPEKDGSFECALKRAVNAIEKQQAVIQNAFADRGTADVRLRAFRADITKEKFKQMVLRAKRYIAAGDIYQANLSQRFSFEFEGAPESLYESLRRINPSPFSGFLKMNSVTVASASPERLVKLDGKRCETRPIAGTRPRGLTEKEDELLRRELIMSPKERAEHIMLVDLERNDLGRVCETASVRVSELMTLEPYSHVVHIVSNVVGTLKKECDRFDLLKAVFPGGTITGCPKIRSMEIIEELEPFKRHLYTGSIGYLDFNGNMDLNIVIRSFVFRKNKGYLQVGAGIVHDSDPEAEYRETLHKAEALIEALSEAVARDGSEAVIVDGGAAVVADGSEHGQFVR